MALPPGFRWGVATAAYQIEGAAAEDGRGPSTWDTFAHTPGRTADGATGDVACDHYHRWPEDVALMGDLGVDAYRFSIAWPRVQPTGSGPANARGLDFYERLVDGLLERGIAPAATLYHWDLPQPLEDAGGWLARDTAYRFAEFAYLAAERLGDRIDTWITLNEPVVVMAYGYAFGIYAPGEELLLGALPTAHHQLLAHGLGTSALRARGAGRVGIANHYSPARPRDAASEADTAAAGAFDLLMNRLFTEPLLLGRYPDLAPLGGPDPASYIRDEDLPVIAQPIDLLGVNYYQPTGIAAPADLSSPLPFELVDLPGHPVTGLGWPIVPDGLHGLLTGLRDTYGPLLPPVHITENGCSFPDEPGPGGAVDDAARIAFLDAHIGAVRAAVDEGVDVRAYYVWSLLDNFEWASGYGPRFGLVHVDYATQKRTPKASFAWYRDLIAASREPLAGG
ncbi:GH1 family beta-glucosidase [Actinomadura parmotrematis]|uniref:Beta-glucosidase n=1 Tax=Actinomadura parmotrematis TaxID=2864039 RepID=A0ABS7FSL5_9ACTN|nr:GH1 family beta-glucosidase [Actinomadura parmotrematis]MBW8482955.1 beta-glucosidase [Actinomadura parmotrematis]